jgi:FkbM family methyltransferase
MNIVDIGCGQGEDEGFFFAKAYRKFLSGSSVFLIDASRASLEASRNLYQKCFEEKEGIKFYFLNYAITNETDTQKVPFYTPKREPTCGLSSLSPQHARAHGRNEEIEEVLVEALTINALFKKLNLTQIDRLFIDTEGWDAKILLDLDLDEFFVPSIHFERLHIDGPFENIDKKGPLATQLLDKFKKYQYATIPHREWEMIATAQPINI